MAGFSVIENFKTKANQNFLDIAKGLEPELVKNNVVPVKMLTFDKRVYEENICLKKEEGIIIDFGDHQVGHLSFSVEPKGSHFDAPLYIFLKFAENKSELEADSKDYNGWISKSWLQEEYIHIDILPQTLTLPRRYAFRYVLIKVIDTSPKYGVTFKDIYCTYESSVGNIEIESLKSNDSMLNKMDSVGIKTLKDCMQKVFEDGPKRDKRLWLGDLRLQARANYQTFKDYNLVKRCLYLFAGMTFEDGRIGACLFHEPEIEVDDTYLMDYALLFGSILYDYYEASKDRETLNDLYSIAMEQIQICINNLDEDYTVKDLGDEFWCFIDWADCLNKQACAHAVLIYAIRYGIKLASIMHDDTMKEYLNKQSCLLKEAAIKKFWDSEKKLFVSGEEKQISWATQIWMILARIFEQKESRELLLRTIMVNPDIKMVTPYMYHHYIDALIRCGEEEMALEEMKRYWGGMIEQGADTFWELYNPENPNESPYGSSMINSYCHAWSCTPTYLLRKFFFKQ